MTMTLDDVDLYDLDLFELGDPHEVFKFLRREAPIYKHVKPSGEEFWCITRYAEGRRVLDDPMTFSSELKGMPLRDRRTLDAMQQYGGASRSGFKAFILADPPEHTWRRAMLNKRFTPRSVRDWEPMVRRIAKRVLDEIEPKGECDFVMDVAHKVPAQMTLWLLGVPEEDLDLITEIEHRMFHTQDEAMKRPSDSPDVSAEQRQMVTQIEIQKYFAPLIEERRAKPGDDLVSTMLHAEVNGHRLTDNDVRADIGLFIAGGLDTTRAAASAGGLLPLIERPDQMRLLRENPSLIKTAVDEFVRWGSPIVHVGRTATRDVEFEGHRFEYGDRVGVWLASCNRDEDIIPEPFRYDVTRDPNVQIGYGNDHLGFGHGEHFCIGANLARLTLQVEFEELLNRFGKIELAGEPRRVRSFFVGGLQNLPIRFEA